MAAYSLILDTKENFLWEKQSREVIPPPDTDETLTKSGVAADAKAVGEKLANKADLTNSVYCEDKYHARSYMISVPNTGDNKKTVDIVLSSSEQFVFILAGSSLGNNFASIVGGSSFVNKHLMNSLTTSTDGNIVHITLPSWFRGVMISYLPFSINGL